MVPLQKQLAGDRDRYVSSGAPSEHAFLKRGCAPIAGRRLRQTGPAIHGPMTLAKERPNKIRARVHSWAQGALSVLSKQPMLIALA